MQKMKFKMVLARCKEIAFRQASQRLVGFSAQYCFRNKHKMLGRKPLSLLDSTTLHLVFGSLGKFTLCWDLLIESLLIESKLGTLFSVSS